MHQGFVIVRHWDGSGGILVPELFARHWDGSGGILVPELFVRLELFDLRRRSGGSRDGSGGQLVLFD